MSGVSRSTTTRARSGTTALLHFVAAHGSQSGKRFACCTVKTCVANPVRVLADEMCMLEPTATSDRILLLTSSYAQSADKRKCRGPTLAIVHRLVLDDV